MRFSRKRQQQVQLPPYTAEVLARVTEAFPGQVSPVASVDWPTATVGREELLGVCRFLRDEMGFAFLTDLTGVDWLGRTDFAPDQARFEVVYHLFSLTHNRRMRLKVRVSEGDPHLPSVVELWPTANFHEREVFDFYGVIFDGHPNLTKILTADFMAGHPLRKDFPLGDEEIWDEEGGSIVQQPGSYRTTGPEGVRRFR